jgi:uncharacterized delta-60 repeat protein
VAGPQVMVSAADEIYVAGYGVSDQQSGGSRFLAKLNTNGTVELFMPTTYWCGCGMTEEGIVLPAMQGGKVILAGYFATDAGHQSLARFSSDGTEDLAFVSTDVHLDSYPHGLLIQPDGKIVYASSQYGPGPVLTRFNADGTLDLRFPKVTDLFNTTKGLAEQPDGKILISGARRPSLGPPHDLVRLNVDGTVDGSFGLDFRYADVRAIALQPNGRILLAGSFQISEGDQPVAVVRLRGEPVFLSRLDVSSSETHVTWRIVDPSLTYDLQGSDDLQAWPTLQTVSPPADLIELREPAASARFYRVISR